MTMAQQTAVDCIISQLRQLAFNENTHLGMGDVRVTQGLIDELEERGKQIEKKQILDAICANQNGLLRRKTVLEAIQYYEETFASQESPDTKTSQS